MELRHLRYFVTVAELLNFTKASSRLHVAQPALSRQIHDLEEELGAKLFDRGQRAMKLTEAGVVFLPEAKAVLQRADEATRAVRSVARGERGHIHIGYAPSPTVELLPLTLHAFQNLAPDVGVSLHDFSTEEMVHGLGDGKLDLCLMVRPSAKALRRLTFESLREYPMCVAMSPKNTLAKLKRVSVRQLVGELLVTYARKDYPEYHTMLEELFANIGGKPRVAEEHDSAPSLIAATEAGCGLAIVPSCMAILTGGRIQLRPLHPAPSPLSVGAAFDSRRFSLATQKFLTAARNAAKASQVGR